MLTFAISLALVSLSSFFITALLTNKKSFIDSSLNYFTIFLSQIILVGITLGIMNKLFAINILLLEFFIALFSFFLYAVKKPSPVFNRPDFAFIAENKIILLSISLFIGFFIYKLFFNLMNPPLCADSLQYHLTFPATWLQNGNLNNPIVIFGSQPTSAELSALSYYPINAELFFFWLMFPLRNAFFADVGEAPFYIIGILAIYSILRKFNLKKNTAFLAGMLWALIPNLFKQLKTASQVDVICAVLFLLVLNNLLTLGREFSFKNASFLGITLGLFFGTKVLNLYWALSLLPLFLYLFFLNYREIKLKRAFLCLSLIALFTILMGGFSYIRTYLTTGNPFYPVKVILFGKEVFPGFIDKVTFSKIFVNWRDFSLKNMFFSEGLGVQFIFFIFFATVVPVLSIPFLRKRFFLNWEYIFLAFIPPCMFLMYIFVIKAYWVRYIFPYLGMGMIVAFLFLDKFKWGKRYITIFGLVSIFSSAAELAHRKELFISLSLSLLIFIFLLGIRKKMTMNYFFNTKIFILIPMSLFTCFYFLNEKYNQEEFSRSVQLINANEEWQRPLVVGWKWLNDNTGTGKRIAYTGRSEFYPLFGQGLKNKVFYISTNDKPNLAHYFPDGLYRKEKNFQLWNENLKKEAIDYLFVALPQDVSNESSNKNDFPIEDEWAVEHPELFNPVFRNSLVHIYAFQKEEGKISQSP